MILLQEYQDCFPEGFVKYVFRNVLMKRNLDWNRNVEVCRLEFYLISSLKIQHLQLFLFSEACVHHAFIPLLRLMLHRFDSFTAVCRRYYFI